MTQPDTIVPDPYNPLDWNRYSYARYNPLRYNDPTGHNPVPVIIAIAVVALKVIDYGWTGYDILNAGITYFDVGATPEDIQNANETITQAIVFELMEPDEGAPGLPIDDIIRHGDEITMVAGSQIHHFASNKHLTKYTEQFEQIVKKYGLSLDQTWNKLPVPNHKGKHPSEYHEWVLQQMKDIDDELGDCGIDCADEFIELFTEAVIKPVLKDPSMLKKIFWE